jgi:hypothetical protein
MGGGFSGGDIVQADLLRLHTKKQFKEEYKLRFAERDRVTEEIELRESQVRKIDEALLKPFSEGFILVMEAREEKDLDLVMAPILGVCSPINDLEINDLLTLIHSEGVGERDIELLESIKVLQHIHVSRSFLFFSRAFLAGSMFLLMQIKSGYCNPLPYCRFYFTEYHHYHHYQGVDRMAHDCSIRRKY